MMCTYIRSVFNGRWLTPLSRASGVGERRRSGRSESERSRDGLFAFLPRPRERERERERERDSERDLHRSEVYLIGHF